MLDLEKQKENAARKSLDFVREGMRIGLGTGSTAAYFIRLLGQKIRQGFTIEAAIPTSSSSLLLARQEGIPLADFDQLTQLDLTVDGTDEVDAKFNLIKGGGGALFREKLVASISEQFLVIADSSKQVELLGAFPLPVEVVPFGRQVVRRRIEALGATANLRINHEGKPFETDQGNYIFDCSFGTIGEPDCLAQELDRITGVLEHGLFVAMADILVIGVENEVRVLRAVRNA